MYTFIFIVSSAVLISIDVLTTSYTNEKTLIISIVWNIVVPFLIVTTLFFDNVIKKFEKKDE